MQFSVLKMLVHMTKIYINFKIFEEYLRTQGDRRQPDKFILQNILQLYWKLKKYVKENRQTSRNPKHFSTFLGNIKIH